MSITGKGVKKNCPTCDTQLIDKGIRTREIMTICGPITIRRTYYRCPHCTISFYPDDERLNISRGITSKAFAKICSQLLIFMPFEHAAKTLNDIYRGGISETFLKDLSDKIGTKLYKDFEHKGRMPYNLDNNETPLDLMYIHADGAMVPIKGEKEREYRENKLGLVYTSDDIVEKASKSGKIKVHIRNKRYVSSIGEGVDAFKKLLSACARENGYRRAKRVILLTDGAVWLKKMKDEYFPDALHILDWYHAVDHLWSTAKTLFGDTNKEACEKWVSPKKELLWDGNVDKVIAQLAEEGLRRKKHQTAIFELRGYYVSNRKSMKYDSFRKKGYYIGSGAIESANKYIMADRLKRTGMRWTLQHANAIIWLRCKYFEDQWDEFWGSMNLSDFIDHDFVVHEKVA